MFNVPVFRGAFLYPVSDGAKLEEGKYRKGFLKQSGNTYFYVPVWQGRFLFVFDIRKGAE